MPTEARTARGAHRRARIVAAAADLLLDGGPDAVTARGCAAAAGVPLGAITYYFSDGAALRRAALAVLLERHVQSAAAAAAVRRGASARAVAERVVAAVLGPYAGGGADGARALYARTLSAAQDPTTAADLARWDEALADAVRRLLESAGRDASRARAVLACADGFLLAGLLADRSDVAAEVVRQLADVLGVLAPRPAGRSRRGSLAQ